MIHKNRKKYLIFLGIIILIPVIVYSYVTGTTQKQDKNMYSVILHQGTENEWVMLEAGAEQAKDDAGIAVNYVYLDEDSTAEEEIRAIHKEMELGTSGILLASVDSMQMQEKLKDAKVTVPLIFVDSGAGEAYPVIRSNDYQMGKELGKAILKDLSDENTPILILGEQMDRDNIMLRYQGLTDCLKENGKGDLIQDETGKKTGDIAEEIADILQKNGKAATLDKYTTEQTVSLWESYQSRAEIKNNSQVIYGIGNTPATVSALDNENLAALVYQNEFSMGYQGMMSLALKKDADWISTNIGISYNIVRKETLYEEEHARLLFPNS